MQAAMEATQDQACASLGMVQEKEQAFIALLDATDVRVQGHMLQLLLLAMRGQGCVLCRPTCRPSRI
jgi:hypothetical protein